MKKQHGLTLVELVLVIVLISIIAMLSIPQLQRAIINANEASAISALRVISQSQNTKFLSTDSYFPLGKLSQEGFLDERFAGQDENSLEVSTRSYHYKINLFTMADGQKNYVLSAIPVSINFVTQTGAKRFGVHKVGVIYFDKENLNTHFETLENFSGMSPVGD